MRPVVDCQNAGVRGKSRTVQSEREKCELSRIISKFKKTGMLPMVRTASGRVQFGDFTNAPDFMQAQLSVVRTKEAFEALPAKVQDKFRHDPAELLAFLADEANTEEAIKLGLVEPKAIEKTPEPKPEGSESAPVAK